MFNTVNPNVGNAKLTRKTRLECSVGLLVDFGD